MQEIKKLNIKDINENKGQCDWLPKNPRFIKDDKFKKLVNSISEFPDMLNARPIIVNKEMVILGGNMRYKACKELGLKEVPVMITDFTKEQQKEFLIKDNANFGDWDFDLLANDFEVEQLADWGTDVFSKYDLEDEVEKPKMIKENKNFCPHCNKEIE